MYLGMHMPQISQEPLPNMQASHPILPPGPPSVFPRSPTQLNDTILETQ